MLEAAASRGAELEVDTLSETLISRRASRLLERRRRSEEGIEALTNLVFNDARAVAEAANARERTMAEVLDLLKQAGKFGRWLRGSRPTRNY